MRLVSLLTLLVLAACSSSEPEIEDSDKGELGEAPRPATPTALDPLTHFKCKTDPSKDCPVDLTTYVGAGAAEWDAFKAFYSKRHTMGEDKLDAFTEEVRSRLAERRRPLDKLTNFVALAGYTQDVDWMAMAGKPQDYRLVNTALRNRAEKKPDATTPPEGLDASDVATLEDVEGYVKAVASAVNSMKPVTGKVHRRVNRSECDDNCVRDYLTRYGQGRFIVEPSFTSSSTKPEMTCAFIGQFHFVIEANGLGRDVAPVSDIPEEAEVVFRPVRPSASTA